MPFSFFAQLPRINKIVFLVGIFGIALSVLGIQLFWQNTELVILLDDVHWTFGTVCAAILTYLGYKNTKNLPSRKTFLWFFIGYGTYALGQVIWDIQTQIHYNGFPSPSDIFYLLLGPSLIIALFYEIYSHKDKINISAFWLDLLSLSVAALTLILVSYLPRSEGIDVLSMSVMVAYPITFIIPVFMLLLMIPSMRLKIDPILALFVLAFSINTFC